MTASLKNSVDCAGWRGRVWIAFENKLADNSRDHVHASGLLSTRCINTGTGGGGDYDYPFKEALYANHKGLYPWGYDITIFEDDWPTLCLSKLLDPTQKNMAIGYHSPKYHIIPEENQCIQTGPTSRYQSQYGLPQMTATT
jgi:hypothetical protein